MKELQNPQNLFNHLLQFDRNSLQSIIGKTYAQLNEQAYKQMMYTPPMYPMMIPMPFPPGYMPPHHGMYPNNLNNVNNSQFSDKKE